MRCTMCKARRTIVLTPPEAFVTVGSWAGACSQARRESIRSECHAWENCPCRSNSGPFGGRSIGAGRAAAGSADERRVLLGTGDHRVCPARHHRDYRRRVQLQDRVFNEGDYVYINKGSGQGVKVGDEFSVVRPIPKDFYGIEWTKWQWSILKKMGTMWEDEGRVKVLIVRPDVSIGQVENACDNVQRGDVLLPFTERPVPPLKPTDFDRFAPANGKSLAMVITGKKFQQQVRQQRHHLREPGGRAGREGRRLFPNLPLSRAHSTRRFIKRPATRLIWSRATRSRTLAFMASARLEEI